MERDAGEARCVGGLVVVFCIVVLLGGVVGEVQEEGNEVKMF